MSVCAPAPRTIPDSLASLIPPRRSLLPLLFVTVLLGCDAEEAALMAESGELFPAFNLAVKPRGLRQIRIWRGAILRRLAGLPATTESIGSVVAQCLPSVGTPVAKATVGGTELAHRFCISHQTITALIRSGELAEQGRHNQVNESPRVPYSSARDFLERRAIS